MRVLRHPITNFTHSEAGSLFEPTDLGIVRRAIAEVQRHIMEMTEWRLTIPVN